MKVLSEALAKLISPTEIKAALTEPYAPDQALDDMAVIDGKTFEELRRFAASG